MNAVLVTGGAGYIGSHVVRRLLAAGREVVVVDDLSEGHREALGDARLVRGDFGDARLLDEALGRGVRHVMHLAASCLVGESVADPGKYYENNLIRSLRLLDAAVKRGVRGMVFSSSAAVYGESRQVPIPEDHPVNPTNPYGETKLAFERALRWYHRAHGFSSVSLRYFNAAGADPTGEVGEDHDPETHLVPLLLQSILKGGPPVPLFGHDYPTPDGTCIRDYIHVSDIAEAHVQSLDYLDRHDPRCESFNLGNGEGFSVNQVVETVHRITGTRPPTKQAPRRPGDPAVLVASAERAKRELGWQPKYPTLDQIVTTAWQWHQSHPNGYQSPSGRRDGPAVSG